MNKWAPINPVQLCIHVPDLNGGCNYAKSTRVANLSKLFINDEIGICAFVLNDPEGYQIEIQSSTREGA